MIPSFGGAANTELAAACGDVASLQAAYQQVIDDYALTHVDFDIEGAWVAHAPSIARRSAAIAGLQTIVFEREGDNRVAHFDLAADPLGVTRLEPVTASAVALRKRLAGRLTADRALALERPPQVEELRDVGDLRQRLVELGYTDE